MRRSTVLAVALAALSIAGLAGCGEDPAPAAVSTASPVARTATAAPTSEGATTTTPSFPAPTTAGGAIDPAQALALAEETPYAATLDFTSGGGPVTTTVKGRVNLNGQPIRIP